MKASFPLLFLALFSFPSLAFASSPPPWFERWGSRLMIQPIKKGMLVRLPVIDTDPNRGVTFGFMPTWVFQGSQGDRILHIHAPSLTYNQIFGLTGTYRYYHYPTPDSTLILRGSLSRTVNREVVVDYDNPFLWDGRLDLNLRFQYLMDGSYRFFGVGPNTPKRGESNYTLDSLYYQISVGAPLRPSSPVKIHLAHRLSGEKISDGPIDSLPDIQTAYPGAAPAGRRQTSALSLHLNYETRDNTITTTQGTYADLYAEVSGKSLASMHRYDRLGLDARHFYKRDPDSRLATAIRLRFEQLYGDVPFWLLPQLGGKYVHRAYGEGRYVDKGLWTLGLEERWTVHRTTLAGVPTDFGLDPFIEIGSVFQRPDRIAFKHLRPAVGIAFRAVARPQVVGSADFAIGQQGLSIYVDINYSY